MENAIIPDTELRRLLDAINQFVQCPNTASHFLADQGIKALKGYSPSSCKEQGFPIENTCPKAESCNLCPFQNDCGSPD